MIALEKAGVDLGGEEPACVYIACASPECREAVFSCALALRRAGIRVEADYQGRSLKSQFKQADRLGASTCVIIGPDELERGTVTVRDMATHEQVDVDSADLLDRLASF